MSRTQAEGVIKNIIREIAQECASKGQAVSETLVAFMVKAVVLEPHNEFNVNRALTKDDVQRLIELCVDRLLDANSPSLDTVKMQVYFDMNYTSRYDFLEEHRRVLDSRLTPVIREITDSRSRTREELESLYRKIVSAILLKSGLGSPVNISVVREATAALQSVFPQTELGTFMSLTKRDKERQISELTMIVTGIRLFNKDCGKGGEGIDDLPAILNEAVPATSHSIDADIQSTLQTVYTYTAILEQASLTERPVESLSLNLMTDALINARQHEQFLRIILNDIISCAQQVQVLETELANRLDQLKSTVQSKTAVPTAQVYPQFMHLANIWSGFQDEMVLLSVQTNILSNLNPFFKGHREIFTDEVLGKFTADLPIKSDEDRIRESTQNIDNRGLIKEFPNVDWIFPENTKNFNKLIFQYKEFCPWYLVHCDRLLLPANPAAGAILYKDNYYIFSDRQKAYDFAENPEWYLSKITEAAKRSPELIQLLELHTQFSSITPYTQKGTMIEKPIIKSDVGVQTDTHFIESYWDKNYEWNEWELRRKAIKLANLRNRLTKSMQTNLSNFRRDNVTQVYLPKDVGLITKHDNYSNVPKPQVYLEGLRGCGLDKPTNMTKVDLTVDVEEQLFLSHKVHRSEKPELNAAQTGLEDMKLQSEAASAKSSKIHSTNFEAFKEAEEQGDLDVREEIVMLPRSQSETLPINLDLDLGDEHEVANLNLHEQPPPLAERKQEGTDAVSPVESGALPEKESEILPSNSEHTNMKHVEPLPSERVEVTSPTEHD